jgi:protein SCO1
MYFRGMDMKGKKWYIICAAIIVIGIALGILYIEKWRDAGVKLPEDITLQTPSGEDFSFSDMEPKVRLVEFYYTKCPDVCPLTTQRMMHLKTMFDEENVFGDKVEFISISIDPEKDTPEAIQKYMKKFGIEENSGWTFLRGSLEDVEKVAEPFRFQFNDVGTDFITHTSYTYLIDENNELREKFPMGEAFDKEKVYKKIMKLID